jgi:hypothetical protein
MEKENHRRSKRSATPSRRQAAPCSPRPAAWTRTSCARRKQSSANWRRLASSAVPIRPGRRRCTWSARSKKDGSWRPCSDYRQLNLATTHARYPLPSVLDLSNKLHSCKFFSCIDLVKGYHQIPMAIITPFDLFKYLFMPFVLRNAAQTFQRFKDSLFKHLPFVFCYLDDIIVASHTL